MTLRRRAAGLLRAGVLHRDAWLNLAAKLGAAGLSFLLYVALARLMTPAAFADVAVVLVWSALAAVVATLCMPLVVVRFVAEGLAAGHADRARGVIRFALSSTLAAAVVLGVVAAVPVLVGWVTPPRDLGTCILLAAALLPPSVVLIMLASVLQGLRRVAGGELLVNVTRPLLILVALLGMGWWRAEPLTAPTALALYLVATVVIVPVCLAYATAARPAAMAQASPSYERALWLRTGLGFAGVLLAAAVNERVDMLVLGVTARPQEIAVYAVAARFAQIIIVGTSAVTAVLAPLLFEKIGELHAGRPGPLEALVRRYARTILLICGVAFLGFAALGPLLLAMFGADYAHAYGPLVTLAAGQVLAALFGPAVMVTTFIGAPRIAVGGLALGIVVNSLLNIALVPAFGAHGAAIATAAGTVASALTAWAWTRHLFQLDTAVLSRRRRTTS